MKPGGVLILELPCMNKIIQYLRSYEGNLSGVFWNALWGEQHEYRVEMCHKYGYTYEMMTELLQKAGFSQVLHKHPRYHFKERDMRFEAVK